MKKLMEELIATQLIVTAMGFTAFAAASMGERILCGALVAMSLFYVAKFLVSFKKFSASQPNQVLGPSLGSNQRQNQNQLPVSEEDLLQLMGHIQTEANHKIGKNFQRAELNERAAQLVHALDFVESSVLDASRQFFIFRSKSSMSSISNDLAELEGEILQFGQEDKPLLVVSEFQSKSSKNPTLVQFFNREVGTSFQDLVCHGVFEGVDLITNCGLQKLNRPQDAIRFFSGLQRRYKHVIFWISSDQYNEWKPILEAVNLPGSPDKSDSSPSIQRGLESI